MPIPSGLSYGLTNPILVTPTLTVHATYTTGDYIGTSGVPMKFANAVRSPGGTGMILDAELIDGALQSVAMELWLFDAPVTPPADSAAWTISDADAKHLIAVIKFETYTASAANSASNSDKVAEPFKCADGSQDIHGCLVLRGVPAAGYADGDIAVLLRIWPD